jgi:hypothetical protein
VPQAYARSIPHSRRAYCTVQQKTPPPATGDTGRGAGKIKYEPFRGSRSRVQMRKTHATKKALKVARWQAQLLSNLDVCNEWTLDSVATRATACCADETIRHKSRFASATIGNKEQHWWRSTNSWELARRSIDRFDIRFCTRIGLGSRALAILGQIRFSKLK